MKQTAYPLLELYSAKRYEFTVYNTQFVWLTFLMFLIYIGLEYIHVKNTMLNFMINKKFGKRLGHIGYSNYILADIKAQIHRDNVFVKMTKDI